MSVWPVSRGGSWYGGSRFARVALRYNLSPDFRDYSLGVRLVRRCA